MTKKKGKGMMGIVLGLIAVLTAVLTYVSLALNFITSTSSIGKSSTTDTINLSKWFEAISDLNEAKSENIGGWNVAKIFLIITLVVVGLMLISLVVNYFVDNKIVKLASIVLACLVVVSAVTFLITTIVGCSALSGSVTLLGITTEYKYLASVGTYLLSVCAIASGVTGILYTMKK